VLEGRPLTETAGVADARAVTPGYFETLGAELVEGRWFSDGDRSGSEAVAIVDTMLAQRLWPGSSAVGRRLQADPGTTGIPRVLVTIVGVVRHMRHRDLTRDLREQMYFPAAQSYRNPMTYVMHASAPLPDLVPHVRAAVAAIDPALPAYELRTFGSYTDAARAVRRFTLLLNAAFAVAALMLAAVGVYGVTRYAVICREREFGLRLALGARSPDVALMVLREGVALGACGAAIGCLGAAVAAYFIRLQLYNVSPADPAPYVAAAAAVMISALIASSVPASRAARATPVELLRPAS
jgi:hypothetical protein